MRIFRPEPRVGVSLLSWNQYDDTAKCLASLRTLEFRPAIILVFDNGSTDGSPERLKTAFPEIELVVGGKNLGFAEGNNRAVKRLLDAGMDYVWILNNDTEVLPDCLGQLVRTLEEDPNMGAVGGKIWFMEEHKPICYAGASFNRLTFRAHFRGLRDADVGQYDQPGDTEVLSGCCMLIRSTVVRRMGLFNRKLFAYSEDLDWCLRARENGVRLGYEPHAALWHKMYGSSNKEGGRSVPKSTPRVEYLLNRNWAMVVRLHTPPWSLKRWLTMTQVFLLHGIPRALGLLFLPRRHRAGWAALTGMWAGLRTKVDVRDCLLSDAET